MMNRKEFNNISVLRVKVLLKGGTSGKLIFRQIFFILKILFNKILSLTENIISVNDLTLFLK